MTSKNLNSLDRLLAKTTDYAAPAVKRLIGLVGVARDHRSLLYRISLALSIILLSLTTIYAAFNTSNYFSTSADALIATQQFSDGLQGNTVALPGSHANILMMPLLYVQGHLPYNYASFTIVNIGLVFITVAAWAILLIKLFGRRYEVPILLLLASLLFASVTFNLSLGNTTFRNIAYPIALWFVFTVSHILKGKSYSHKGLAGAITSAVLFSLVLAGDSFFNYSIIAPLLLIIVWYWLQSQIFTKAMLRVLGLITVVLVGAAIVKFILAVTETIYFDYAFLSKPTVLPSDHLGPSVQLALKQLMELQGGSIFGRTISLSNLVTFINLGVLVIGIVGLVTIIRRANRNFTAKKELATDNSFVFVAMAVSYFVIFFVYIFSGYVVAELSKGEIVNFMNTRYITFLPLIAIIGFVWFLKTHYNAQRYIIIVSLALITGILTHYPAVRSAYALADSGKHVPSRSSVDEIIGILNDNNVSKAVTDFWYGPPLRFWSNGNITYAPQINCNQPLPFDSREDWFIPQKNIKSALIIDRGGMNFGYWGCTDRKLVEIYGKPVKEISVAGIKPGETVKIWVYDYDASQRLLPFPKAN